ncbi:hypothetical protein AALO_G00107890 [Alosa alosa]|uniref:Reverse transcriptase domain-containing protein n=1 Tax=Alosa alosa TaxID=278164 RepID=A0AAV6GNC6_9TELE|nr:hypothetical protein AALO_G00107890 [Alosa alosa]
MASASVSMSSSSGSTLGFEDYSLYSNMSDDQLLQLAIERSLMEGCTSTPAAEPPRAPQTAAPPARPNAVIRRRPPARIPEHEPEPPPCPSNPPRANRFVDDAVNMAHPPVLGLCKHLCQDTLCGLSSAFNTIIPARLQDRLYQLNVPDPTCRWIIDFLSGRKQHVRMGRRVSDHRTISTGAPQGCVLFPLLFSLYTNHCTSSHKSVKLLKFVDDTTLIGLTFGGDESAYRREIDILLTWCSDNNLELNAAKTVEIVVDFKRNPASLAPIILHDIPVNTVESLRFRGTIISHDLNWEHNISSLIKKAHQRMFFLR